ncbi:hypothetical protein, partial [Salmonella enterica]|uniref:hypothetical protein n=1 Tax=Salmonella enterica TaxID=28901 RepID=UPI0014829D25
SSGDHLEGLARVSGMSAQEFAQQWQQNPQEAILSFIQGLGEVQSSGGDVVSTLEELGIKGIRNTDTLSRLAGAGDLTAEAFDLAN